MLRLSRQVYYLPQRTHKNFGHKREPEQMFTVLWHGFLTFSFIGLGLNWRRIINYFAADDAEQSYPLD
ncbi:unnamed protein product [Leptosia nina]|uniref:Uncharacterized protein n=1 Tax=Leptosia nina TaxID=320188 RepID=A0AAV1JVM5_9NEOP